MVFTFSIRDFIFVDFEASSIDADSCSIEVGVAWIADDIVHRGSSLIRPQTYWNRSAWSAASAQVHRIAWSELDTAPSSYGVAFEYRHRVLHSGYTAVSDAPEWDGAWAEKLLEAVDGHGHQFVDFDHLVRSACRGNAKAINHTYAHLEAMPSLHRAGCGASGDGLTSRHES
ncbi:hypothetical protein SAMN04488004_1377 [Loktanella salsilacus]|uniref:Exonuclease n=1 Tax=Loktanella salsilacus TaxID=195913 RepID=A0A1I4JFY3_9RHOB|nr:hypothetical protein [Loktanella salsilacus]SFL65495.1 hypothetical protein SAMN04488004_1377 [Loktanella salsilacus]